MTLTKSYLVLPTGKSWKRKINIQKKPAQSFKQNSRAHVSFLRFSFLPFRFQLSETCLFFQGLCQVQALFRIHGQEPRDQGFQFQRKVTWQGIVVTSQFGYVITGSNKWRLFQINRNFYTNRWKLIEKEGGVVWLCFSLRGGFFVVLFCRENVWDMFKSSEKLDYLNP